jgi:hypothetical protein
MSAHLEKIEYKMQEVEKMYRVADFTRQTSSNCDENHNEIAA